MADKQLSYDYQNVKRDLAEVFGQVFASLPLLISLIAMSGAATSTKHEWLEDEISVKKAVVGTAANSGATSLTLVSTAGIEKGMILRFETAAGVSLLEQVRVAAVTNGTTLSVSRGYGGTTPAEIPANAVALPIAKPLPEATDPEPSAGREPTVEYNYTQILDRTAKVSKTAEAVKKYGIGSALNYQTQLKMRELTRDLNSQIIYGRRVQRDGSNEGSFGGVMQYLENGITESSGGIVNEKVLNNVFEAIFEPGGISQRYAICVAPNQARKISKFMTAGNVPAGTKTTDAGFAVNRFVGDIPAFGGNPYEAFVSVDPNLPKDRLLVLDLDRIKLVPLTGRTWTDEDASPAGADYFARRILGEYTLEVKNGKTCHGQAVGLEV